MPFENSPEEEIIPTMDFTTILTDDEPTIHVKHYFDIIELEKVGLKLDETLLFCGARLYFNEPQLIYLELIRMFWRKFEFLNSKAIVSWLLELRKLCQMTPLPRPLGVFVRATPIMKVGRGPMVVMYPKPFTKKLQKKFGDQKIIVCNLMCERANIINKSGLHKAGLETTLFDLHKFVLLHLMENLPFYFPHNLH